MCDIAGNLKKNKNKNLLGVFFLSVFSAEKIYWSWTSSLKLWITRRLSRRRPMKLRGSSVRLTHFFRFIVRRGGKKKLWLPPPRRYLREQTLLHILHCAFWHFEVSSLNWQTHFHNLMLQQRQSGFWSDVYLGLDGRFLQFCADYCERYWMGSDSEGNRFMHHCSITEPVHIYSSLLF